MPEVRKKKQNLILPSNYIYVFNKILDYTTNKSPEHIFSLLFNKPRGCVAFVFSDIAWIQELANAVETAEHAGGGCC